MPQPFFQPPYPTMSRSTYLFFAIAAIGFGTFFNYSMVGGSDNGSRSHGGGVFIGGGAGGHK